MDKLIAPKLCAYCREPFTPKRVDQRFCTHSCASKFNARHLVGQVPMAAVAAKRERDRKIATEKLALTFGPLTDREVRLYWYAHRVGYDDGYYAAYQPLRRKSA